ncbi:hypothetical protein HanRHA438_Chr03g0140481 [Helianthus annuus]|nr:hypothetical protein HanRHA438_Chr03g0140481 [Helianthus annuus]
MDKIKITSSSLNFEYKQDYDMLHIKRFIRPPFIFSTHNQFDICGKWEPCNHLYVLLITQSGTLMCYIIILYTIFKTMNKTNNQCSSSFN